MTKKRRMFDIDLPADDSNALSEPAFVEGSGQSPRRGPMAIAIGEAADANRRRTEIEAEIRIENDALAHEFVRLKKLGLVTNLVPLDAVHEGKLVRDRSQRVDPELGDLKASINALGLSNPILVEADGQGGYELVQGWRRLQAFRALHAEIGEDRFAAIPATLMPAGETMNGLYRRMVDENLVRKDISWAEMARLARSYAEERVGGCDDLDEAVNLLYASVSPQKRSYIRRFAYLLLLLDKYLEHPEAISRNLGLVLAKRFEMEPATISAVARSLQAKPGRTVEEELDILRSAANAEPAPRPTSPPGNPARGRPASRAKTSLRLELSEGELRCTAAPGRVELRINRDFSSVERQRLEAAIAAFFSVLDRRE